MKLRLHIERLVVDGLDLGPGGGGVLRSAVEKELSRLFAEGGWRKKPAGGAIRTLPVAAITAGSDPARIGVQVARALYDGLAGTGGSRR